MGGGWEEVLAWARDWVRRNGGQGGGPGGPGVPPAGPPLAELVRYALLPPFQVLWKEGAQEPVQHREFWAEPAARNALEDLAGAHSACLRHAGRTVARSGAAWDEMWDPGHAAGYARVRDMFPENLLARLGPMSQVALVRFDGAGLGAHHHGLAQRCPATGCAVCVVNPRAADREYVVLHELMHHQLDALGCPALVVPALGCGPGGTGVSLGGRGVPNGSPFTHCAGDEGVVARVVTLVWELVQHSRFNGAIRGAFGCGPEGSRDGEARSLLGGADEWPYCSRGRDPGPLWCLFMGLHYMTVLLEGSPRLGDLFRAHLLSCGEDGAAAEDAGRRAAGRVPAPAEPWDFAGGGGGGEAQALVCGMLADLEASLNELPLGLGRVVVGPQERQKGGGRWGATCRVEFGG